MSAEAFVPKPLLCHRCLIQGRVRDAWTVGSGAALCVRCSVDQHAGDDMDQHDLVADLYEQLRMRGHGNAY